MCDEKERERQSRKAMGKMKMWKEVTCVKMQGMKMKMRASRSNDGFIGSFLGQFFGS
jgi:hypothetical protein